MAEEEAAKIDDFVEKARLELLKKMGLDVEQMDQIKELYNSAAFALQQTSFMLGFQYQEKLIAAPQIAQIKPLQELWDFIFIKKKELIAVKEEFEILHKMKYDLETGRFKSAKQKREEHAVLLAKRDAEREALQKKAQERKAKAKAKRSKR